MISYLCSISNLRIGTSHDIVQFKDEKEAREYITGMYEMLPDDEVLEWTFLGKGKDLNNPVMPTERRII
jgi:hypothetical protein